MQRLPELGRLEIRLDLAQMLREKVRDSLSARLEIECFEREPAFITGFLKRHSPSR